MANCELLSFTSANDLADAAARAWLEEVRLAGQQDKGHCVALSGGRITQKFFAAVVARAPAEKIPFGHVHFFWADERCVPPEDAESNFKLASEKLFQPLGIVTERIHRIRGEAAPERAAEEAGEELRAIVPTSLQGRPLLDLIFLGMGEDGHVASLFPTAPAKNVDISVPFFVVKDSPKPPPTRISLSYRAIFDAKKVWVLISGAGKSDALRESLSPSGKTPLARVIQARPVKIFSVINEF